MKIKHREYIKGDEGTLKEFFLGGIKDHFAYWLEDGSKKVSLKFYELGEEFCDCNGCVQNFECSNPPTHV